MTIVKELNDKQLTIKLEGELNTTTAPLLEEVIKSDLNGISSLVFDLEKLEYLSSAGLRMLLVAQKIMDQQGKMAIRHANKNILEVFDITGFSSILDIEN